MVKTEKMSACCGSWRSSPISSSGRVMSLMKPWMTSGAAVGEEKPEASSLDPT